jgi:glutathione S-transferase
MPAQLDRLQLEHRHAAVASQWSEAQLAERLSRIPTAERREAWTRVARKPYTDEEKAEAMRGLLALLAKMERCCK